MSSASRITVTLASILFLSFFSCTSSEGQKKKSTTSSKKTTTTGNDCESTSTSSKKTSTSKKSTEDAELRLLAEQVTYESDIKELLDDHCVSCHGKGAQDPDLTSYEALISEKSAIISTIQDDSMPPGTPFNTTKKETFNLWKQNDFAEGAASSGGDEEEVDQEEKNASDEDEDEKESTTSSSKCGSSTSSKTTSGTSSSSGKTSSSSKNTADEDE